MLNSSAVVFTKNAKLALQPKSEINTLRYDTINVPDHGIQGIAQLWRKQHHGLLGGANV
jgi:hypothetical protein